ncbi:small GTPase superfamily [Lipomyces oligophaga]|uniref:small GTPase superfamily n=1 Tax=Lipomyces oligophaga TaxID=45792 RepID=UPI0034CD1E41
MSNSKADYSFKIVTVGDQACGKTSLLLTYTMGVFPELYMPTIFENRAVTVKLLSGKSARLDLFDTAGQEQFDRLRPLAYNDTNLVLIAYSVDNPTSLQNISERWWPEVSHYCSLKMPIVIVGLKTDLRNDPKVVESLRASGFTSTVSSQQGREVAKKIAGGVPYVECSAKSKQGVDDVFNTILDALVAPKGKTKYPGDSRKPGRKCILL